MITIVKGDLNALKEEMVAYRKASAEKMKKVIKEYGKNKVRLRDLPQSIRLIVEDDELIQMMYKTSRTLPAYVGAMVIDIKTAEAFLKKLKGFETEVSFTESGIQIKYWHTGRRSKGCGSVKLYDLKRYFGHLKNIPTAQIAGLNGD